jgi:hypothetical protein
MQGCGNRENLQHGSSRLHGGGWLALSGSLLLL